MDKEICKYCKNLTVVWILPTSKQMCTKYFEPVALDYTCIYYEFDSILKHKWDRFEEYGVQFSEPIQEHYNNNKLF